MTFLCISEYFKMQEKSAQKNTLRQGLWLQRQVHGSENQKLQCSAKIVFIHKEHNVQQHRVLHSFPFADTLPNRCLVKMTYKEENYNIQKQAHSNQRTQNHRDHVI